MIVFIERTELDHHRLTHPHRLLLPRVGSALELFVGSLLQVRRKAFKFGPQKNNLHVRASKFDSKANLPVQNAHVHCFIATRLLKLIVKQLQHKHWPGQ